MYKDLLTLRDISRSELDELFELTAVPYAVWGNREPGEMTVWIRALI